VYYVLKSIVPSVVVSWARSVLESEVDLCWCEWDSVAARGVWWGRIMAGGGTPAIIRIYDPGTPSQLRTLWFFPCILPYKIDNEISTSNDLNP
jgi:hypothetical protein